ncbi:acyltransferase family protein [Bifidobacterium avesanii]|uniref:Acyltransferase family protein n=1 Tax=Bifidobacterium avesanii TaxID=1798157 RepID=A0A7K3TJ51_9BIFI|nr:acyltransferase family protein [Bifidobacterium avesanii]NEG78966.1 acyltransferase family protein [Bifidobacterium avesanii]
MVKNTIRNGSIDLIRTIGIIAIVATHAFSSYPITRTLLYPWQVPIFFVLSGWFWKSKKSPSSEIKSRCTALLIPYCSWLILLLTLETILYIHSNNINGILRVAWNALRGGQYATTPFTVFWFITALLFARIYLVLIERIAGTIGIVVVSLAGIVSAWLIPYYLKIMWLSLGLALPCTVFIVAGIIGGRFS